MDVAGQDATEAFEDIGHSDEAREILDGLLIGNLKRAVSWLSTYFFTRMLISPLARRPCAVSTLLQRALEVEQGRPDGLRPRPLRHHPGRRRRCLLRLPIPAGSTAAVVEGATGSSVRRGGVHLRSLSGTPCAARAGMSHKAGMETKTDRAPQGFETVSL